MSPEPCLDGQCRYPLACEGFGYCRERNAEGVPRGAIQRAWRAEAEQRRIDAKPEVIP